MFHNYLIFLLNEFVKIAAFISFVLLYLNFVNKSFNFLPSPYSAAKSVYNFVINAAILVSIFLPLSSTTAFICAAAAVIISEIAFPTSAIVYVLSYEEIINALRQILNSYIFLIIYLFYKSENNFLWSVSTSNLYNFYNKSLILFFSSFFGTLPKLLIKSLRPYYISSVILKN